MKLRPKLYRNNNPWYRWWKFMLAGHLHHAFPRSRSLKRWYLKVGRS